MVERKLQKAGIPDHQCFCCENIFLLLNSGVGDDTGLQYL
jgi:hypothetical protein